MVRWVDDLEANLLRVLLMFLAWSMHFQWTFVRIKKSIFKDLVIRDDSKMMAVLGNFSYDHSSSFERIMILLNWFSPNCHSKRRFGETNLKANLLRNDCVPSWLETGLLNSHPSRTILLRRQVPAGCILLGDINLQEWGIVKKKQIIYSKQLAQLEIISRMKLN